MIDRAALGRDKRRQGIVTLATYRGATPVAAKFWQAIAIAAPADWWSSITDRYRLADRYLESNLDKLIARDVDLVILRRTSNRVAQPFFWRTFRDHLISDLLDGAPPALPTLTPVPTDASIIKPRSARPA